LDIEAIHGCPTRTTSLPPVLIPNSNLVEIYHELFGNKLTRAALGISGGTKLPEHCRQTWAQVERVVGNALATIPEPFRG
jgi:hypothetical protein